MPVNIQPLQLGGEGLWKNCEVNRPPRLGTPMNQKPWSRRSQSSHVLVAAQGLELAQGGGRIGTTFGQLVEQTQHEVVD
jgi:hypothetical protein